MEDDRKGLYQLLGDKLLRNSGKEETTPSKALAGVKVVCLYFSASWCPPCKAFLPTLVSLYNDINSTEKRLEIVFVSGDDNEKEMIQEFNDMPWLGIPFDSPVGDQLAQEFGIQGIPALLIMNGDGSVATSEGRNHVRDQGNKCIDTWIKLIK
jgi:nucleoredoxin